MNMTAMLIKKLLLGFGKKDCVFLTITISLPKNNILDNIKYAKILSI